MKTLISLILFLFISFHLPAKTVEGVDFSEKLTVGTQDLILNGIGIRKATWFKVKVYVGGLYLPEKITAADKLIELNGPKKIIMHFVRDVDKEKLNGGWEEAFKRSGADFNKLKTQLAQFYDVMPNIKEGEKINIEFFANKVSIQTPKQNLEIAGKDFSKSLLSVWFINAKDEELRDGLLGVL